MKKIIILFTLIFNFSVVSEAQDLIVLSDFDSIPCKITKEIDGMLAYKVWNGENFDLKVVKVNAINSYQKDYFVQKQNPKHILESFYKFYFINQNNDTVFCNKIQYDEKSLIYSEIIDNKTIVKEIKSAEIKKLKRIKKNTSGHKPYFEIMFFGGYAQRTMKISDDIPELTQDLIKGIKHGFFLSTTSHFYLFEYFAIGAKYNYMGSSGKGSLYLYSDLYSSINARSHVDIKINYYALEGVFSVKNKSKKIKFDLSSNIGLMTYKEIFDLVGYNTQSKSQTIGYGFGGNLSLLLSKGFGMMFHSSFLFGKLSKFKISGDLGSSEHSRKNNKLNINQLDIGAGFFIRI